MRRRVRRAVVGASGVLATVLATVLVTQLSEPDRVAIVVPQTQSTEASVRRPVTVDIPELPPMAATTEIVTPPTTEPPRPPATVKPKPTSSTPSPTATPAPPPPPQPPVTTTATPQQDSTAWYFDYFSGFPFNRCAHRCR